MSTTCAYMSQTARWQHANVNIQADKDENLYIIVKNEIGRMCHRHPYRL